MVYITKYNANRILEKFVLKDETFTGTLYDKPIYIFNKYEEKNLLAYKGFMQNPSKFISCMYKRIQREDTFRYVYEGNSPAYHESLECERLTSNLQNFCIPEEIIAKGREEVIRFRKWFNENIELYRNNPEAFQMRMFTAFGINVSLSEITLKNTGIFRKENLSLEEIKEKLDELITDSGRFFYANSQNTTILRKYGKRTFLAHRNVPLENNDTGLSDEEVKKFLIEYEMNYKFKIIYYLREYYRISYNPNLAIDKKILDELGFRPCSSCCKNHS